MRKEIVASYTRAGRNHGALPRFRLRKAYGATGARQRSTGSDRRKARLAFIQEKWEASSKMLGDDVRQIRHDEEEDRDQASRHTESV
jgi:hypothetical protein